MADDIFPNGVGFANRPVSPRMEAELRAVGGTAEDFRVLGLVAPGGRREKLHEFLIHFHARGKRAILPHFESLTTAAIAKGFPRLLDGITLAGTARFTYDDHLSDDLAAFYVVALRIKRPDFAGILEQTSSDAALLLRFEWNPFREDSHRG